MLRKRIDGNTSLIVMEDYEGETIEKKLRRVVNNKEPITDGAPIVYTERKDGVLPEYNIRTDKWDLAIEAMDVAHKTEIAKRKAAIDERSKPEVIPEDTSGNPTIITGDPKV